MRAQKHLMILHSFCVSCISLGLSEFLLFFLFLMNVLFPTVKGKKKIINL